MEEMTLLDLASYYPTALTPAMKKRIETFEGKPVEPTVKPPARERAGSSTGER